MMQKTKAKQKKGARRWAFPLGLLIAILAIVGLVTILVAGVTATKKGIQKSKNYDEYNQFLVPVVMNDPDAFDDITNAKPNQLIDIAIWSIVKSGLSPEDYEYTDNAVLLPQDEVDTAFHKLFGPDVKPIHSTVEGYGYDFNYDASKHVYVIPLTGVAPLYTPKVLKTEKKKNAVIVTVAYLAGDQWQQDDLGNMVAPEPEKYMRVTLRKAEEGFYISALQNTSAPEIASSNKTEPQTEAPTQETQSNASSAESTTGTEIPSEPVAAE